MIQEEQEPLFQCVNCGHESHQAFKYCPKCGTQRAYEVEERNPFKSKDLKSLLAYFFISLFFLILYKNSEEYWFGMFEDMVLVCTVLAVIDLGFAFYNGRESFLFGVKTVHWKPLTLITVGLVVSAFVVSYVADFLNSNLSDGYNFDPFSESYPLYVVIISHCLYPALFEELSFRGFMINNVRALSNDRTAIGVSAFLFGITHISFISLIWLIPLGLLFGYLRIRYNTLWYGIIGHFVYNLVVTLIERGIV